MGNSLDDLSNFPADVKRAFGYELRQAQMGEMPRSAKTLGGFGAGVFELRDRYAGDAYRAVYAVRLPKAIYVLHAFKKKSKSGISMPREDVALIVARLKRAYALDQEERE